MKLKQDCLHLCGSRAHMVGEYDSHKLPFDLYIGEGTHPSVYIQRFTDMHKQKINRCIKIFWVKFQNIDTPYFFCMPSWMCNHMSKLYIMLLLDTYILCVFRLYLK